LGLLRKRIIEFENYSSKRIIVLNPDFFKASQDFLPGYIFCGFKSGEQKEAKPSPMQFPVLLKLRLEFKDLGPGKKGRLREVEAAGDADSFFWVFPG
jgi:hypothetical protein